MHSETLSETSAAALRSVGRQTALCCNPGAGTQIEKRRNYLLQSEQSQCSLVNTLPSNQEVLRHALGEIGERNQNVTVAFGDTRCVEQCEKSAVAGVGCPLWQIGRMMSQLGTFVCRRSSVNLALMTVWMVWKEMK